MNIQSQMSNYAKQHLDQRASEALAYFPTVDIDPQQITMIMINEVVANTPENDFYSSDPQAAYLNTTLPLLQKAGLSVHSMADILALGIYVTSAVKLPKRSTTIQKEQLAESLPLLEKELGLFPNVRAMMLNGDVAKKKVNQLTKAQSGKNAIPAVSTYKLRNSEIYYRAIRLFPAYIMTGKNILIEKSKVDMTAADIAKMVAYVASCNS